jgi:hypothetical protein
MHTISMLPRITPNAQTRTLVEKKHAHTTTPTTLPPEFISHLEGALHEAESTLLGRVHGDAQVRHAVALHDLLRQLCGVPQVPKRVCRRAVLQQHLRMGSEGQKRPELCTAKTFLGTTCACAGRSSSKAPSMQVVLQRVLNLECRVWQDGCPSSGASPTLGCPHRNCHVQNSQAYRTAPLRQRVLPR